MRTRECRDMLSWHRHYDTVQRWMFIASLVLDYPTLASTFAISAISWTLSLSLMANFWPLELDSLTPEAYYSRAPCLPLFSFFSRKCCRQALWISWSPMTFAPCQKPFEFRLITAIPTMITLLLCLLAAVALCTNVLISNTIQLRVTLFPHPLSSSIIPLSVFHQACIGGLHSKSTIITIFIGWSTYIA